MLFTSTQPTFRHRTSDNDSHDEAPEIWSRELKSMSRDKGQKGHTHKEAVEGKPKSKLMPKPSRPQRFMLDLDRVVTMASNDLAGFHASILAHATNGKLLQAILEEGYVTPGSRRHQHGRIHSRFVDVPSYLQTGTPQVFHFVSSSRIFLEFCRTKLRRIGSRRASNEECTPKRSPTESTILCPFMLLSTSSAAARSLNGRKKKNQNLPAHSQGPDLARMIRRIPSWKGLQETGQYPGPMWSKWANWSSWSYNCSSSERAKAQAKHPRTW